MGGVYGVVAGGLAGNWVRTGREIGQMPPHPTPHPLPRLSTLSSP